MYHHNAFLSFWPCLLAPPLFLYSLNLTIFTKAENVYDYFNACKDAPIYILLKCNDLSLNIFHCKQQSFKKCIIPIRQAPIHYTPVQVPSCAMSMCNLLKLADLAEPTKVSFPTSILWVHLHMQQSQSHFPWDSGFIPFCLNPANAAFWFQNITVWQAEALQENCPGLLELQVRVTVIYLNSL